MDLDFIKATILIIFTLLLLYGAKRSNRLSRNKRSTGPASNYRDLKAIAMIVVGVTLFMALMGFIIDEQVRDELEVKSKAFRKAQTLICSSGEFKRDNEFRLVSKSDGWSIYNDKYFKKGDLLLEIAQCEVEKQH